MKYIICAGHDKNGDPGAEGPGGIWEADLTIELRDLVIGKLNGIKTEAVNGSRMEVRHEDDKQKLQQTIDYVNSIATGEDFLLDIHFNYNEPKASGPEVFYSADTNQKNISRASELARAVAQAMGLPSRGAKPDNLSQYSRLGILSLTKPQALLLEVCFLTEKDLSAYQANKEKVAQAIAMFLFKLN